MIPFYLLIVFLLGGCASSPPPEQPVTVITGKVAVAVPCGADLGKEPDYPDTNAGLAAVVKHPDAATRLRANPADMKALTDLVVDLGNQLKLVLKGRLMRIQRDHEKDAARAGCVKSEPPS